MKTLKESLLDNLEDMINNTSAAEEIIYNWIYENYEIIDKKIKFGQIYKPLSYEEFLNLITINDNIINIDASLRFKNKNPNKTLTNNMFKFGKISGYFDIWNAELTTLKGGPIEVGSLYSLNECTKLKSLKYLAIKIGRGEIGDGLDVTLCNSLIDFSSMPNNLDINGSIWANALKKLKSTKGLPEIINGNLYLEDNKKLTDISNIKEIKGSLYIHGSIYLEYLDFPDLKTLRINKI